METPKEKNREGRPLKFKTVKILQNAIDKYFRECDPHVSEHDVIVKEQTLQGTVSVVKREKYMTEQVPYTISGLAIALDTCRQVLLNYSIKEEYMDTIMCAKLKIENFAEKSLWTAKNGKSIEFNLKNNFKGWKDKTEVENTGQPTSLTILNYADLPKNDI